MTEHPLTVSIATKDTKEQRDIQFNYMLTTRHPRWELLKIFVRALFTIKFR